MYKQNHKLWIFVKSVI